MPFANVSAQRSPPAAAVNVALLVLCAAGVAMLVGASRMGAPDVSVLVASVLVLSLAGNTFVFSVNGAHPTRARYWLAAGLVAGIAGLIPYAAGLAVPLAEYLQRFLGPIILACLLGQALAAVGFGAGRGVTLVVGLGGDQAALLKSTLGVLAQAVVLTGGVVLLAPLLGLRTDSGSIEAVTRALMLALAALTLFHLLVRVRNCDPRSWTLRPAGVAITVTCSLAVSALVVLGGGEGTTPTERALALSALLLAGFCLRTPLMALLAFAGLTALLPVQLAAFDSGLELGQIALSSALLLALLGFDGFLSEQLAGLRHGHEIAVMESRLQDLSGVQLFEVDLARKTLVSIEAPDGKIRQIPFATFFSGAHSAAVLTLLSRLRDSGPIDGQPVQIDLERLATDGRSLGIGGPRAHDVYILDRAGERAWIGVVDKTATSELAARSGRLETKLTETLLREERLLSVTSHELRTPMAVFSMLAEELDAGADWSDVAPSFRQTLDRVIAILDDLRLHSGSEAPQTVQTVFTLRALATHLKDTFGAAAEANGITLRFSLSQQSDALIQSDYGRVYIALSKLLHNAIVHSKGSEIILSALMVREGENGWTVTWQVSDNGIGIAPAAQKALFRPFDTDVSGMADANPGLGLYTARQAMELIGGDLTLRTGNDIVADAQPVGAAETSNAAETGPASAIAPKPASGTAFILRHPARPAKPAKYIKLEQQPVNEMQVRYPDKSVLLIEDNRIVGDITVARLRRLVGTTVWAETGTEGLEAYIANPPDLILVDQLLPGMLGSEVIKKIRATNTQVPIVGITASTLGSECAELEAAGATYALEKPLSLPQLQKIVGEFFE